MFKTQIYQLLTCLWMLVLVSCKQENAPVEKVFEAVVVGHAYGNPSFPTNSIYPNFLSAFDTKYGEDTIDLLLFTGDVVKHGDDITWQTVEREVNGLNVKEWYIALGNHDTGNYLEEQLQPKKYLSFVRENNLFLVLNTSNPGWTLDSDQLNFLEKTLEENEDVANIFVFSHQLWWIKEPPGEMELEGIQPNSHALFDGESSFWKDAFPFFEKCEQQIYFFGGDLGCCEEIQGYYFDQYDRFSFYGSGIGGGLEDNFLTIQIFQDQSVQIGRADF